MKVNYPVLRRELESNGWALQEIQNVEDPYCLGLWRLKSEWSPLGLEVELQFEKDELAFILASGKSLNRQKVTTKIRAFDLDGEEICWVTASEKDVPELIGELLEVRKRSHPDQ